MKQKEKDNDYVTPNSSLSFEVFPNPAVVMIKLFQPLQDMRELTPHFISVTASNNKFNIKETTVRLADSLFRMT